MTDESLTRNRTYSNCEPVEHTLIAAGDMLSRCAPALLIVVVLSFSRVSAVHGFQDESERAHTIPPTAAAESSLVRILTTDEETIEGRVIVDAADGGVVLEDRLSQIHILTRDQIAERRESSESFHLVDDDERALRITEQLGPRFRTVSTDHFLLCHDLSDDYAEFLTKLLEEVRSEFLEFASEASISVGAPRGRMVIIAFRQPAMFHEYAGQLHPDETFENVPGFYSVKYHVTLLTDVTGVSNARNSRMMLDALRRQPRQAETAVHETIHHLCFELGLMTRMADNPLWLSEGLATWFEQSSGRGPLLWNRPGLPNRTHTARFRQSAGDSFRIPPEQLISGNEPFRDQAVYAEAYAQSWGLVSWLASDEPTTIGRLFAEVSQRAPLAPVPASQQLSEFFEATNLDSEQLRTGLQRYARRVRVPR